MACCVIEYAPEMVAWEAITVATVATPAKTKAKTSQPAWAFGVKSWLGFAAGDVLT
jgi:hypothetical protein